MKAPFDNWARVGVGGGRVTLAPGPGSGSDTMTGDSSLIADGRTPIYLPAYVGDFQLLKIVFIHTIVSFSTSLPGLRETR